MKNKKHIYFSQILNSNKGITLIALVITIIILLILAGVVLNLALGENGIFKLAKDASQSYKLESAREKVDLAILSYQAGQGKVTLYDEILKINGLSSITTADDETNSLPYTVIVDGFEFEIDKDLNVIYKGEKNVEVDDKTEITLNYTTEEVDNLLMTINVNTNDTKGINKIIVSKKADVKEKPNIIIKQESVAGKEKTITVEIPVNGDYIVQAIGNNGTVTTEEVTISNIKEGSILSSIAVGEVKQNKVLLTLKGETQKLNIKQMKLYVNDAEVKTFTYPDSNLEKTQEETYELENMKFYADNNCKLLVITQYDREKYSEVVNTKNIDTIASEQDLINLQNEVNKTQSNHFENRTINLIDNITITTAWAPIGYSSGDVGKYYFSGIFDGRSHYIELSKGISTTTLPDFKLGIGLFGQVLDGKIKNLEIKGTINTSTQCIGGIVGGIVGTQANKAEITNCINSTTITAQSGEDVGGISGLAINTNITNCTNKASITGKTNVGGICGSLRDSSISLSKNTSTILANNGWNAGGIVGVCEQGTCSVSTSYNTGGVTQTGSNAAVSGGIVGVVSGCESTVTNCYNSGSISSRSHSGGIVGSCGGSYVNSKVTMSNCYNIGNIISSNIKGALVSSVYADKDYISEAVALYCYWSDKDKKGNALPIQSVGEIYDVNKVSGENCWQSPISIFTTQDADEAGNCASYYLNGENSQDAWIQDFEGDEKGKYINDKYPYLKDNPPEN